MMRVAAIAIVLVPMLSIAVCAGPVYRNPEFGIVLPVPSGATLCIPPKGEQDQGPYMLLANPDEEECHDLAHYRSISIFASYNAADETKTLVRLLRSDCTGIAKAPCKQAPQGLSISGLRTLAGMVDHSDDWIDIFVVTQAGKPDPDFDPSVPSINYELRLRTRRGYLRADLAVFREVLRRLRISPPN